METVAQISVPSTDQILLKRPLLENQDEDMNNDEEWEMPLLFMTSLPTNFMENVDVAAISTFSADYEEDLNEDAGKSPPKAGKVQEKGKYRLHSRRQSNPYSKSRKANVAELQVCLKLFNM
ncbi:unnamed protein product [Aphanomyces euteiches]